MTPKQKRLLLPIVVLTLGFLSLVGTAIFIIGKGGEPARVSSIGGPFTLINQDGQTVTDATYKGTPTLVFFGFTRCPDVCPTTLFEITEIFKKLPKDAKVSALFVTVDPERDTPASMKDYLGSFDPRISGLSGNRAQVDAMLKAYRVYSKKVPTDNGDYTMDHTAIVYLMDKQGRFVNALNIQQPPDGAAREIQRVM